MLSWVKWLVLCLTGVWGLSGDAACLFLAARLRKVTTASCRDGMCSISAAHGLSLPIVPGRAISCAQAQERASKILTSLPHAHSIDTDLAVLLGNEIIPAITDLVYLRRPLSEDSLESLMLADAILRSLAVSSDEWESKHSTEIRTSVWLNDLLRLAPVLVTFSLFSVDPLDVSTGIVANFIMDVVSVTGPLKACEQTIRGLRLLASRTSPRYRERYPDEISVRLEQVPVVDSSSLLRFSSSISESGALADKEMEFYTLDPFLKLLTQVWGATDWDRSTSVWQMINLQIRSDICPRLRSFAASVFRAKPAMQDAQKRSRFTLFFLRLILICREVTSPPDLLHVSSELLSHLRGEQLPPGILVLPSADQALMFFTSSPMDNTAIILGQPESAIQLLRVYVDESEPFDDSGTWRMFKSRRDLRDHFEETMVGLGRALALAMRKGVGIGGFGLPRFVTNALRPLSDELDEDVGKLSALSSERLRDSVYEPAFFICEGARDILGAAGFDVFTPKDFLELSLL